MLNKKQLFESIMTSIAKEVKTALNEYNKYENADHHRGGNIHDLKFLAQVLTSEYGYKAYPVSSTLDKPYQLILRRESGVRKNVYVQQRKKGTMTGNIALKLRKYGDEVSILDNPEINEICLICPPVMNYDPRGEVVDNTKACFFEKDYLKDKVENGEIPITKTRDGEMLMLSEKWIKENAKQIISYKYKK